VRRLIVYLTLNLELACEFMTLAGSFSITKSFYFPNNDLANDE
jgi:hypothetical protein